MYNDKYSGNDLLYTIQLWGAHKKVSNIWMV